jgi:type IV pilus assembly protein PilB
VERTAPRCAPEIWLRRVRLSYDVSVAKRIGELLVEGGILSQSQLEQALFAQRKDGRKLGLLLVELGFITEVQVTQVLSRQLSVPWVSLYHVDFSRSLLNLVPREIAEKFCLVPIFVRRVRKHGETLYVAMDDPTNEVAIEEVMRAAGLPVKPMIACPSDIRAAIRVYYLGESPAPPAAPTLAVAPPPAPSAPAQPVAKPSGPPPSASSPPAASPAPADDRVSSPPASVPREEDSPESAPEVEAEEREIVAGARAKAKMISVTLLDGTTISLPAPPKAPSSPEAGAEAEKAEAAASPAEEMSDQLTARDLVSALRAVAHGADASEILGHTPRWEAMFSALLSLLLRKGLIADWEFVEEFRKV